MLPPALSIAGGVAMVYLAINTQSALVVDDYARIEELTNERFDRDRHAAELRLTAVLTFAEAPGGVDVVLAAPRPFALPAALTLSLRHATNPAADRDLTLVRTGSRYSASADLHPGRYRLELMPPDGAWRLGTGTVPLGGRIELVPQSGTDPPAADGGDR
jgi:uncharacterized protein